MDGLTTLGTSTVEKRAGALHTGVGSEAVPSRLPSLGDPLLRRKYQQLTRKHLRHVFRKVVADYTGLHFHIAWAPEGSRDWGTPRLPTASACCRLARTVHAPQECQTCGASRLASAMNDGGEGLFFECHLGVLNYWLPIRVRSVTLGIAYLQALNVHKLPPNGSGRQAGSATAVLRRADFRRAARLLHLVVGYLQTLNVAELRKTELTSAGHAMVALEREQARLHETLKRHIPPPPLVSHRSRSVTHGEAAVHQLLQWISERHAQPITLQDCATKLGMNVAYLSDLFSRAVGVSFKAYLTEFRLLRAKALLGDFGHTVSEVAYAVGYSNENRFRAMFKKATGLPPGSWRKTLRAHSLILLASLHEWFELSPSLNLPLFG